MNIFAGPRDKIRCVNADNNAALHEGLVYTITKVEVFSCGTDVWLLEVGGPLNSVRFDDVEIDEKRAEEWRKKCCNSNSQYCYPYDTDSLRYRVLDSIIGISRKISP